MVSLLTRLPLPGQRDPDARRPWYPVALAAAATLAVSLLGLVGLGLAVVVVQTLDPSGGLPVGGSARVAGQLWLLAQGGALVLPSGPLVLAPLLLTLAVAWGLCRAVRGVVRAVDPVGGRAAAGVAGTVVAVHTLLAVLLALAVDGPGARTDLLRCAAGPAVLAVAAAGWGVLRESGPLDAVLDRLPGAVRAVLPAVLAGLLTALGLGAAVVAVALAADAAGYAAVARSLGGSGAGAVGLLALGALLLPNAAAAALGVAAGPGFSVGTATVVSVHGISLGPVPALPLLAALPDTQAVPLLAFGSQAVPALAGLVAGTTLGRRLTDDGGGSVVAGLWGVLTGGLLGLAAGVVVAVAGGSLGDGALADVGAPPVATALFVAAQAGVAAAVAAAVSRWRSLG
ncbi:cell division protein PerM [Geodermatophilus sp. URMC 62]|uniref:cell division protein PerM n=1 Tax=Geodermatophilus sp. URMC 62 TaxID=3423414 RepID=UPI00406C095B